MPGSRWRSVLVLDQLKVTAMTEPQPIRAGDHIRITATDYRKDAGTTGLVIDRINDMLSVLFDGSGLGILLEKEVERYE